MPFFLWLIVGLLLLRHVHGLSVNVLEQDLETTIEAITRIDNDLFVGSVNQLHRLSSTTLARLQSPLILGSRLDNPACRILTECNDLVQIDYHFKLLLSIENSLLLVCGTLFQGTCQLIDRQLSILINSTIPVVANDQVNSTVGLLVPGKKMIYIGVTYTNEGPYRWQIPNIAGRSLEMSRFMSILPANGDIEQEGPIYRDDMSLRFMPRQQTNFIVQYIHTFLTDNYIYFVSNQPLDVDHPHAIVTKVLRFCRTMSNSIIRSYTELPISCSGPEWILKTAQTIIRDDGTMLLLGHFIRRDGTSGTSVCTWRVQADIDRAIADNYRTCYAMGNGQRGLAFIKPNEPCRRDESWSTTIINNNENICQLIISDRLPYPVGSIVSLVGRLFYMNPLESSSIIQMHSFASVTLLLQGLTNGTLKLGTLDGTSNINWFYGRQLQTQSAILTNILFDSTSASFFFGSSTKIYRVSISTDCASRLSCDECLSSSVNLFCGWCTTNQRCTLSDVCPLNSWQQDTQQCAHIVSVQPLNASVDHSQWINLTLSKLPQLAHNEIYQCIFTADRTHKSSTQAIKLDHNRLSCPTPSIHSEHVLKGAAQSVVRLSVIKWPSNTSIATVPRFVFYNCSSYSSCVSCRSQNGCQWCSQRCSSMCTEPIPMQCSSFALTSSANLFLESGQSARIPIEFQHIDNGSPLECRLNGTLRGTIDRNGICSLDQIPTIVDRNEQSMLLTVHQDDMTIGHPVRMTIYRCDLYDVCDSCHSRSTCTWCQGRCSSRNALCATQEQCTTVRIVDFSPRLIPLGGQTLVSIRMNEVFIDEPTEISLAGIACSIVSPSSSTIQCRSHPSTSPRQGPIRIRFSNRTFVLSRDNIEYRQASIIALTPMTVYEVGGQILRIAGNNLALGNQQQIFIGDYECLRTEQATPTAMSCRVPPLASGVYSVTARLDNQTLATAVKNPISLRVTPNPLVQDIDPSVSFASGGRLVTIRGMYFGSAQNIVVEFRLRKWAAKLKIAPIDITSSNNGTISSFTFRTPALPDSHSNEIPSAPVDVDVSLYFDNALISLPHLIQFHYIADVLLNISKIPPSLPYTGEELKLQVENLTEAASMPDIELLIGCQQCQLKTFTIKGITCQPPAELKTTTTMTTSLVLNNQQNDCSRFNASLAPIRFRIGYREYLIGYLSYGRSSSSRYSIATIIYLALGSGMLTIALLTLGLGLFFKFRHCKRANPKKPALPPMTDLLPTEKQLWATSSSAVAGPYYQVYEQIPSSSSTGGGRESTLARAPLLVCPYHHHHQQQYEPKSCTPPLMQQLQMSLPFLTTISVEHDGLKQLLYSPDPSIDRKFPSMHRRQSMEYFYDLLCMAPFSQAFVHSLIGSNDDLLQAYAYLFRYDINHLTLISSREISFATFVSSLLTLPMENKTYLIDHFHLFDDFMRILVDFIDASPCDQMLARAHRSLASSTLLSVDIQYRCLQLTIDYDDNQDITRLHVPVLDCDTTDQIRQKIVRYLNSYQNAHTPIEPNQLELFMSSSSSSHSCCCSHQMPTLKQYLSHSTNSIIRARRRGWNRTLESKEKPFFMYHLCTENQLNINSLSINERLKANKNRLQPVIDHFYQQILHGSALFSNWIERQKFDNDRERFQCYIQAVSDLIRRLNRLMLGRSTCSIIQSCLNVIADGLEFIFETKTEFTPEIELLFADDKKHFSSFDINLLHFPSSPIDISLFDSRSLILADDASIECLFKLYQLYELHSEPINQHIGEHHVSVLLPVHHLLVRIRQLLNSDTSTRTTTLI